MKNKVIFIIVVFFSIFVTIGCQQSNSSNGISEGGSTLQIYRSKAPARVVETTTESDPTSSTPHEYTPPPMMNSRAAEDSTSETDPIVIDPNTMEKTNAGVIAGGVVVSVETFDEDETGIMNHEIEGVIKDGIATFNTIPGARYRAVIDYSLYLDGEKIAVSSNTCTFIAQERGDLITYYIDVVEEFPEASRIGVVVNGYDETNGSTGGPGVIRDPYVPGDPEWIDAYSNMTIAQVCRYLADQFYLGYEKGCAVIFTYGSELTNPKEETESEVQ